MHKKILIFTALLGVASLIGSCAKSQNSLGYFKNLAEMPYVNGLNTTTLLSNGDVLVGDGGPESLFEIKKNRFYPVSVKFEDKIRRGGTELKFVKLPNDDVLIIYNNGIIRKYLHSNRAIVPFTQKVEGLIFLNTISFDGENIYFFSGNTINEAKIFTILNSNTRNFTQIKLEESLKCPNSIMLNNKNILVVSRKNHHEGTGKEKALIYLYNNSLQKLSKLKIERKANCAVLIRLKNNDVLVLNEDQTVEKYNSKTHGFQYLGRLSTPINFLDGNLESIITIVMPTGDVLFLGRHSGLAEAYRLSQNSLQVINRKLPKFISSGTFLNNEKILLITDPAYYKANLVDILQTMIHSGNKALIYDLSKNDVVDSITSKINARYQTITLLKDNRILLTGGIKEWDEESSSAELFYFKK